MMCYLPLLFVFGLPALLVWAWIHDSRARKADLVEAHKEVDEFVATENKKKIYVVVVTTKSGQVFTTDPFEPTAHVDFWIHGPNARKFTSQQRAQQFIENSIEADRYLHKTTMTYVPMCEIEKFEVK